MKVLDILSNYYTLWSFNITESQATLSRMFSSRTLYLKLLSLYHFS